MKVIIAQLAGTIALLIAVIIFHKNNRKTMLYLQIAACVMFSMQYLLLGAWTGAAMNIIVIIRNYVFANKDSKKWANSNLWLYLFLFIIIIATVYTWQGWVSVLPLIGMITGTIAFWLTNTTCIRLFSLISPPFWCTYNFISRAYPAMICDTIIFVSIIIGMIRFDGRDRIEKIIVDEVDVIDENNNALGRE